MELNKKNERAKNANNSGGGVDSSVIAELEDEITKLRNEIEHLKNDVNKSLRGVE